MLRFTKYLLIIVFSITMCYGMVNAIFAALSISSQINSINYSIDKKIVICKNDYYNPPIWEAVDKDRHQSYLNEPFAESLYLDNENRIRKYVVKSYFAESLYHVICYYNKVGDLIMAKYYLRSALMYSMKGSIMYINNKYKIFSINNYYNGESENNPKIEYNSLPKKVNFTIHHTTDELLENYFKIEKNELLKKSYFLKVVFNRPRKGNVTYITTNHVNFRKEPSLKSKIIGRLGVLDKVQVLSIHNVEQIKSIGKFPWYKVKSSKEIGYIFGAFLEPVEVEIK